MARSVAVLSAIPRLSYHLRNVLPNVTFLDVQPGKNDTLPSLSKAEILVADANLLLPYVDNLPVTKWVQATWAGLEHLIQSIKNKDVPFVITRFTGVSFGYAMSEYVVSQIVNFERNQRIQYENQSKSLWNVEGKMSNHRRLSDLTIGILGLGEIGKFIVKVLKVFGAQVWGMSTSIKSNNSPLDRHLTLESLPEILQNCDYIVNVLPSTEKTIGILNGDVLKNCSNKKSVFINIGRGNIIKETDLIKALEENWISGAILDVFEEEPLSADSKLWKLPQVTISPHVAGISRAEDIATVFADNYTRYVNKDPLKYVVDLKSGY